jgi:EmrB/QacA subfamily drug resistance transporter
LDRAERTSAGEFRVVEGPDAGLVISVSRPTVIGRATSADVVLSDRQVSDRHVRVFSEDGEAVVEDLGSTNGTFANGRRFPGSYRLHAGDRIKLGQTVLEYTPPPVSVGAGSEGMAAAGPSAGGITDRLRLQVLRDGAVIAEVPLSGSTTTIGRDPDCALELPDKEASRHHARVTLEGDSAFIEDLRSTNGTFVNRERILERRALTVGDQIQIGETSILFTTPERAVTRLRPAVEPTALRQAMALPAHLKDQEPSSRKWWTLVVVCIGVFMLLLDTTIVSVALPPISRALHTSFSQLQWVVDAYALLLAAALLTAGSISDIVGRRVVFSAGLAVFTIASAVCGLAWSGTALDIARGVQGLGGAMMFATSLALLAQEFPPDERGLAFGVWGAAAGVGVAVGPLVGGLLIQAFSWEAIFYVNIPIGIVVLLLAQKKLANLPGERNAIDWAGLVTWSGAIFMLVFAVIRGNDEGWKSGVIVGLFAGAVLLMIAFVLIERRVSHPMLELPLFRKPTFNGALIVGAAISGSVLAVIIYFTLWLQTVLDYSPLQSGLRLLPLTALTLVCSPIGGKLQAKVPARFLLSFGLVLIGVGLLTMHSIESNSSWTVLLPGMLLGGAGIGLTAAPLASTAVGVVAPNKAGMASGINTTFRQLGLATGIAAFGAVFQHVVLTHVQTGLAHTAVAKSSTSFANIIAAGGTPQLLARTPASARAPLRHTAMVAYSAGLSEIFLAAAVVAFVGAVFALLLINERDLVPATGPVAAHAAG